MTAIEKVSKLRNELKELGYNNRKVSIKLDRGTFEESIWVNVKCETSREEFEKIRSIAKAYEEVDYHKGELLTGGNTYVFVQ